MAINVRTQAELDAALAAGEPAIRIKSDPNITLTIGATGSSRVVAADSSRVMATGATWLDATDSSRIVAVDSSVTASDSSHVVARGNSRVVATNTSRVVARGFSHVEAWDSCRVEVWDSSRAEAFGHSHIGAWDSSHVVAWGSSRVEAWGSSHVAAWGACHVEASQFVAVHLHSTAVTLSGGVVVDMTAVDETDPQTWCDLHGVKVDAKGNVILFKALSADLVSGGLWNPVQWKTKGVVKCDDFDRTDKCGGGLHLGPTTWHATAYLVAASRWLKVRAKFTDLQPVTQGVAKVKVPKCTVICEVDRWGNPL